MKHLRLLAIAAAAPAIAQSSPIQPGQWQIAITVNAMEMPGAPAGIARMMVGRTTRVKHCITPADAARGPQELIKSDKSCTFSRYSMAGGKLQSTMTCKRGGNLVTTETTGSFDATSFTATGRSVTTGSMPMTMTATSVGRRLGNCS
jgi:hypothetical protein